jgi:hypothetical protein
MFREIYLLYEAPCRKRARIAAKVAATFAAVFTVEY